MRKQKQACFVPFTSAFSSGPEPYWRCVSPLITDADAPLALAFICFLPCISTLWLMHLVALLSLSSVARHYAPYQHNQALDIWGYLGLASDTEPLDEVAVSFATSVD